VDAADVNAAAPSTTSRQSISRNTRDAKDGSGSNRHKGSIPHDISPSYVTQPAFAMSDAILNTFA
jgi:hypothetical protein